MRKMIARWLLGYDPDTLRKDINETAEHTAHAAIEIARIKAQIDSIYKGTGDELGNIRERVQVLEQTCKKTRAASGSAR